MPANVEMGNLFNDKFDSGKTIQKLVELEKSKAEKWENEKFIQEMRKKAWEGFQKKLQEIDAAVRSFYNPVTSPFRKMKTNSDQENSLTAAAEAKVSPGDYHFKVLQLATADTFRSNVVDKKTKLEPFKFEILFKEKTYKFNFRGGTLEGLTKMLNEQASSILSATLLKVDKEHVVLHIEGKETGKESYLEFKGYLEPFKEIGLLTLGAGKQEPLLITEKTGLVSGQPLTTLLKENSLILEPQSRAEKTLSLPLKTQEGKYLVFKIRLDDYQKTAEKKPTPDSVSPQNKGDFKTGTIDRIWVGDADIEGEYLITNPDFGKPLKDSQNSDLKDAFQDEDKKNLEKQEEAFLILHYQNENQNFLFKYPMKEEWQEVRLTLKSDFMNRLSFYNPFSNKILSLKDFAIQGEAGKEMEPQNSIAQAGDAQIEYKGITIIRPDNKIDDLISGLSLYLHSVSDKETKISVDWNYDGIKEKILEFIVMYNNAMDYIRNTTRRIPPKNHKQTTAWRESFKDMSGKEAEEKSKDGSLYEGILSTDMTINMVKTKLRNIMLAPYETSAERELRFLTQMGISTQKTTASGSAEDRENMNAGFLDFTEEKFEKTLKDQYVAVQEFFFRDSTGNLIFDQGLAIKMAEALKMIVPDSFRGEDGKVYPGLIRSKITMLENNIKMNQKSIEQWEKHVEDYEARLRGQFARMHKAMQRAKDQEGRLKNFGNSGD